jgi:hypothetical protein
MGPLDPLDYVYLGAILVQALVGGWVVRGLRRDVKILKTTSLEVRKAVITDLHRVLNATVVRAFDAEREKQRRAGQHASR